MINCGFARSGVRVGGAHTQSHTLTHTHTHARGPLSTAKSAGKKTAALAADDGVLEHHRENINIIMQSEVEFVAVMYDYFILSLN